MSKWKIAALAILSLAVLAALTLTGLGLFYIGIVAEELPSVDDVFDEMVDALVESGYVAPSLSADPLLEQRTLVITTGINGKTSREVIEKLLYLDRQSPGEPIDFFLASPGGWLGSAFSVIDAMNAITSPVNIHCLGGCYSAGTTILVGATGVRSAAENSILMVHANKEQSDEDYSFEKYGYARFERLYRSRTQVPEGWFPLTSGESYYLDPNEALAFGLIDRIESASTTDVETLR